MIALSSICLAAAQAQNASLRAEDSDWIALPQVAGIVGVPIMPGLQEAEDETIVFDKPGGRIMEARLEGDVTSDDVQAWYQIALEANGWRVDSVADSKVPVFWRDGEILQLFIMVHDQGVDVHLSLAPLDPQ